jgi:hypothetical protein
MTNSITAGGIRDRLKNKARNGFITVPPSIYSFLRKINQLLLTHIGGSRTTLVLASTKILLPVFSQFPNNFYQKSTAYQHFATAVLAGTKFT